MRVAELIGGNVRALRLSVGLTQAELSDLMHGLGFTWIRQTVAETEAGRRGATMEELVGLATIFDMPLTALTISPGGLVPRSIDVAGREVDFADWTHLVANWRIEEPPAGRFRGAIDRLTAGLDRPWARKWRRRGGHPATSFWEARDERLRARSPLPGPTFIWEGDSPVETSTTVPPWGHEVRIALAPGVPYVARDEYEAERLLDLEETQRPPGLRRITRQEAYRLRRRRGK